MIEILPSPPHVVAWRMSGTVDADEYERVLQAVEAKLATHEKIGLYGDMTGFSDMSAGAIAKDLRYNVEKLGQWGRFRRAALVTDKQWMKALVRMADPLFPQIEARAFDPGQEVEAMAWASDVRS